MTKNFEQTWSLLNAAKGVEGAVAAVGALAVVQTYPWYVPAIACFFVRKRKFAK